MVIIQGNPVPANNKIISHLDSIFDFDNPNTLWSIGNHDNTSKALFREVTGKNKFHSFFRDNITFITLDTQDSLSNIVGEQKEFLFTVIDTLKATKHLILLTHKLIFMDQHPIMDSMINSICNAGKGSCFYCLNKNNFYHEILPKLIELRNKSIEVICIGGDLGFKTSEFQYIDENGIIFLGNGIGFNKNDNKVLIFTKNNKNPKLNYEFVSIDSLLINQ